MTTFDAIIIGAGQAGPPLAGRLTAAGMTVAFVERHLFGGTCVNTGCMPTKTLVASAYAAHLARRASDYGVVLASPPQIDMPKVKARADAVSANSRTSVEQWLRNMKGCTVFKGHARFESAHVVRVDEQQLTAPRIFINVGGRALVPDDARRRRRAVPDEHVHPGARSGTGASHRRRRELRRPRVRADVSSIWR